MTTKILEISRWRDGVMKAAQDVRRSKDRYEKARSMPHTDPDGTWNGEISLKVEKEIRESDKGIERAMEALLKALCG